MQKKILILSLLTVICFIGSTVLAQGTPMIPKSHPEFNEDMAATKCADCHKVPEEMDTNEGGFCNQCHQFGPAHKTGPDPAHQVELDWKTKDCEQCHRLHAGPNPTHQISSETKNAQLCIECHVPGNTPEETLATEFCAKCHNLGDPKQHIKLEDKTAKICIRCHKYEE
ncbi:cytochrome c3 family protein [Selenihalanaerobacter shriftii]|uniref:Doubled CXXCH domain-containing protein n=1 Tax=Selenihalanaerobacter shriftii TaxID=142842 RepID=A0A1T4PR09_9FIRM|nr:cytochrome c3 family protein [Selenihalanaerobacter shriftii]SJZ93328.1 doubled CXXCH domain-containing protein [Selenihalanaerobacter shriftii]